MLRTSVIIPEFTRMLWVSDKAESIWKPRISKITVYTTEMEKETCFSGRATIQVVGVERLPELSHWATKNGLAVLILSVEGDDSSIYRASSQPYIPGQPAKFRVVITSQAGTKDFLRAWSSNDERSIGNLLSYPPCCTRFFNRVWVKEKYLDTTWPMTGDPLDTTIYVKGFDECNILLRWAGVRAVPYLPCSFNCQFTKMFSDGFNDKTREEFKWIMEMLSWPVEWSALHGIARIKTPLFEISTRTDHTNEKYTVRREGSLYPAEGARGLVFPFRSVSEQEPALWTDNGFKSLDEMDKAHSVILQVIQSVHHIQGVCDLGCGNGLLLDKIGKLFDKIKLVGVDTERRWWKAPNAKFIQADIRNYEHIKDVNLGLISSNRFKELAHHEIYSIINQFQELIVYSYNDHFHEPLGWHDVVKFTDGPYTAVLYHRNDTHYDGV